MICLSFLGESSGDTHVKRGTSISFDHDFILAFPRLDHVLAQSHPAVTSERALNFINSLFLNVVDHHAQGYCKWAKSANYLGVLLPAPEI